MNEQTVAKVDEILMSFAAKRDQAAAAKKAAIQQLRDFRAEFLRVQEDVIIPAMLAIGAQVRKHGYEFEIEAAQDVLDLKQAEPRTQLFVAMTPGRAIPHQPSLAAICDSRAKLVRFEAHIPTRGGLIAKLGDASPVNLNQDWVQARAVEFLQRVFDGDPA